MSSSPPDWTEENDNPPETFTKDGERNPPLDGGPEKRFVQALSYLIEWAKHIITIDSALMVLSITILKDIVKAAEPPVSYIIVGLLLLFYVATVISIWLAVRFVRRAANLLLTRGAFAPPADVEELQAALDFLQKLFLIGLAVFSLLALTSLLSWAAGKGVAALPAPR